MLKSDVTFDRFLTTFVPGAVFVSGAFYMHRPILIKYFPFIAGYATQLPEDTLGPEARIILFSLAALCMGVIFDQLSDMAIIAVVEGECDANRPRQRWRSWARWLNRFFIINPLADSRRVILDRYLKSNRREAFLRMAQRWAFASAEEIQETGRAAVIHQHILLRLRTLSQHHQSLYREIYAPLASSAALYCALVALFGVSLLAPVTGESVKESIRAHAPGTYIFFIFSTYFGAFLTAYNLKRRIRHFFSQAMTLALQSFCGQEAIGERGEHHQLRSA